MPTTPVTESLFRLGLNESLPISEEATTSRVVVNNDVLRTVVFTFDAGQLLTEHASPKAVVVTLLEGEMDFSVGERTERMSAGVEGEDDGAQELVVDHDARGRGLLADRQGLVQAQTEQGLGDGGSGHIGVLSGGVVTG